ncbi:hypothetical protein HJC23_006536 [Cyclotella cryptica]|uniref:Aspartoacylase n=1 Tax=Cyclotella cryptica TaxID=29204 RepID=A0ABD3PK88_9STRA|eukprot:CCRYP_013620-RA/>CCRYP_013620-RA protein AED:0.03 eAED:0.03 QI:229/0.5/0.33/1/1/1/3/0/533
MGLVLSKNKPASTSPRLLPRPRHPLLLGSAAILLSATTFPTGTASGGKFICSAFAASTVPTAGRSRSFRAFHRGGNQRRRMSGVLEEGDRKAYPHAPPLATVNPFSRRIEKVVIVGGTHGNEYTGVWCIKSIEKQRQLWNEKSTDIPKANIFSDFPTLDIATLLANPVAHMQNKRFVDSDLNREFSVEKLRRVAMTKSETQEENSSEECDIRNEFCSGDNFDASDPLASLPHEALRAREIESILGPKLIPHTVGPNGYSNMDYDHSNPEPLTDVVVDLHTTTANMGISLIIPEGDSLMSAAAAYVLHQCRSKYGYESVQCLMHALPKREDRQNLSSCGRHGFTIEVGPVPQGVLRHDVVEKTQAAMHSLLEFLHLRNLELEKGNANNGEPTVLDMLRQIYPNNIVPCYRSAPAVRPGELSGKISWPNDESNPNFPAVIIHKSLQDRDFEPLRIGDPLFVTLDGTIIPYDGSHGDEVHLIFVNEGGYYYESSGTGIGVAVKSRFDWETGWFFVDSDDEAEVSEEIVVEETDSYE